jgi:hypothetical protein
MVGKVNACRVGGRDRGINLCFCPEIDLAEFESIFEFKITYQMASWVLLAKSIQTKKNITLLSLSGTSRGKK